MVGIRDKFRGKQLQYQGTCRSSDMSQNSRNDRVGIRGCPKMSIELRPREIVVSTCERLRPIAYSSSAEEDEDERAAVAETVNVGTSLFELYLSLQHMAT